MPLNANEVADLLVEIGQRLELGGESPFKFRAYFTAAENLRATATPLEELVAKAKLRTIPGVGEAIAEKILKLHRTGSHPTLDNLREQHPAGLLQMMAIPGFGPKKILEVYNTLGIDSVDALEAACKSGGLKGCKGIGPKLQATLLEAIAFARRAQGKFLSDAAEMRVLAACEQLAKNEAIKTVLPAGGVRRGSEIVEDLAVVAVRAQESGTVFEVADRHGIRLGISDESRLGTALVLATGSALHIEALKNHAMSKGLSFDEAKGLTRDGKEIVCKTETEFYTALGLPFIEPELREGRDEIERAQKGTLPKLVALSDIKGILHSHTRKPEGSDGVHTLEQMAEATRTRGYQYYGVADHSRTAVYANGLKESQIVAQHKLAGELNAGYEGKGFRIFKGIESDIIEAGALDYDEATLKTFDFVVASIHSRFALDKAAQTARLIAAVANPRTTILGHMTGRLLLQRAGYEVDIEAVLAACAKHGVAVEINAHPARLDLDWRWHQTALDLGCMLSINPDAHSIDEIDLVKYGVGVARKGGVPPERVLNCMPLEAIAAHFAERAKR